MGGNASSARKAREREEWESKIYKRVPYVEARAQFQRLSLRERKAKIWDECPISTNVHVVSKDFAEPPKQEFIIVYRLGPEYEGSHVGVGYKGRYKDRKYHIDNSLGYVLGSPLYKRTGWPWPKEGETVIIDPTLTLGFSRLQYDSLFPTISPPTGLAVPIASIVSTSTSAASLSNKRKRPVEDKSKNVGTKLDKLPPTSTSPLPVAKFFVSPPGGLSFTNELGGSSGLLLFAPSAPPLEQLIQTVNVNANVDADTIIDTTILVVEGTKVELYEVAG